MFDKGKGKSVDKKAKTDKKAVKVQNDKPVQKKTPKQVAYIVVVLLLTLFIGIASGVYLTYSAKAEGVKRVTHRDVPTFSTNYRGIKLDDGVTLAQFETFMSEKDAQYGGYISQNATVKSKIFGEKFKKGFDTYSLILNDKLQKTDSYLSTDKNIVVEKGSYPAYVYGTEWRHKKVGNSYKLQIEKSNGTTETINIVVVGKIKTNMLEIASLQGEPYVNSFRSLIAVKGVDINNIVKDADRTLYVDTSLTNADFANLIIDNNIGKVANKSIDIDYSSSPDLQKPNYRIFSIYLYFVMIIVGIILISIYAGNLRPYMYIVYAFTTVISMVGTYFIKIKNSLAFYSYSNIVDFWVFILSASVMILSLLVGIILLSIAVARDKYNQFEEEMVDIEENKDEKAVE